MFTHPTMKYCIATTTEDCSRGKRTIDDYQTQWRKASQKKDRKWDIEMTTFLEHEPQTELRMKESSSQPVVRERTNWKGNETRRYERTSEWRKNCSRETTRETEKMMGRKEKDRGKQRKGLPSKLSQRLPVLRLFSFSSMSTTSSSSSSAILSSPFLVLYVSHSMARGGKGIPNSVSLSLSSFFTQPCSFLFWRGLLAPLTTVLLLLLLRLFFFSPSFTFCWLSHRRCRRSQ